MSTGGRAATGDWLRPRQRAGHSDSHGLGVARADDRAVTSLTCCHPVTWLAGKLLLSHAKMNANVVPGPVSAQFVSSLVNKGLLKAGLQRLPATISMWPPCFIRVTVIARLTHRLHSGAVAASPCTVAPRRRVAWPSCQCHTPVTAALRHHWPSNGSHVPVALTGRRRQWQRRGRGPG